MICYNSNSTTSIMSFKGALIALDDDLKLPLSVQRPGFSVWSSDIAAEILDNRAVYFDMTDIAAANTTASLVTDIVTEEARTVSEPVISFTANLGASDWIVMKSMRISGSLRAWLVTDSGLYGIAENKPDPSRVGYWLSPVKCSVSMPNPLPKSPSVSGSSLPQTQAQFTLGRFSEMSQWTRASLDSHDCFITLEPVSPFVYQRAGRTVYVKLADLNGKIVEVSWQPSVAPSFALNNLAHAQGTDSFTVVDPSNTQIGLTWEGSWSGLYCYKPLTMTLE